MIQLALLQHNRGGLQVRRERMRQKPLSFAFPELWTGAHSQLASFIWSICNLQPWAIVSVPLVCKA